eukprot:269847-Rhodomonas_salina.2
MQTCVIGVDGIAHPFCASNFSSSSVAPLRLLMKFASRKRHAQKCSHYSSSSRLRKLHYLVGDDIRGWSRTMLRALRESGTAEMDGPTPTQHRSQLLRLGWHQTLTSAPEWRARGSITNVGAHQLRFFPNSKQIRRDTGMHTVPLQCKRTAVSDAQCEDTDDEGELSTCQEHAANQCPWREAKREKTEAERQKGGRESSSWWDTTVAFGAFSHQLRGS